MDAKYHYQKCNRVKTSLGNSYWSPCFAGHGKGEPYYLPVVMSLKDADTWLSLIAKEIPFKWEFLEHNGEQLVKIYPPKAGDTFIILFGNLTKGVSEAAWFCEEHLKDTSNDPFFVKSWKAFKKLAEHKMTVNYNHYHIWFKYGDDMKEGYPRKSKTIKEVFDKLDKLKPPVGTVWATVL